MAEKEERSPWKKFVRGFWITLGCIVALFVFFIISMIPTEDDDRSDITDNQEYVITVSNGTINLTYYCSGYARNLVNSSFILIDYNGEATNEIVITSSTFFVIGKNPDFKKEYFEKKKDELKPVNKTIS